MSGPQCPPRSRNIAMGDIPSMPPPPAKQSSVVSSIKKCAPEESSQNITLVGGGDANRAIDHFRRLEETFQAYTLALHLRRGNMVDKVLRGRAAADELSVNELYNTLGKFFLTNLNLGILINRSGGSIERAGYFRSRRRRTFCGFRKVSQIDLEKSDGTSCVGSNTKGYPRQVW